MPKVNYLYRTKLRETALQLLNLELTPSSSNVYIPPYCSSSSQNPLFPAGLSPLSTFILGPQIQLPLIIVCICKLYLLTSIIFQPNYCYFWLLFNQVWFPELFQVRPGLPDANLWYLWSMKQQREDCLKVLRHVCQRSCYCLTVCMLHQGHISGCYRCCCPWH